METLVDELHRKSGVDASAIQACNAEPTMAKRLLCQRAFERDSAAAAMEAEIEEAAKPLRQQIAKARPPVAEESGFSISSFLQGGCDGLTHLYYEKIPTEGALDFLMALGSLPALVPCTLTGVNADAVDAGASRASKRNGGFTGFNEIVDVRAFIPNAFKGSHTR